MADKRLTFLEKTFKFKKKIKDSIKSGFINDESPSKNMKDVPSIEEMKNISDRYNIASLLPYESYDFEKDLYYNNDTVGFMLYASPSVGMSVRNLKILNSIFDIEKVDATIQISLISDPNIEYLLDMWKETKVLSKNPNLKNIFEKLSNNRAKHLASGKWGSLYSDRHGSARDYHLIISCTFPIEKGEIDLSNDDLGLIKRTKDSTKNTLKSAGMDSINLEPSLFINIMSGLLNPSTKKQPSLVYDDMNRINDQMVDSDSAILFGSGVSSIIHQEEKFSLIPFNVKQYPNRWNGCGNGDLIGSFTNNVLKIKCPFIATLTANILDQVKMKSTAKQRRLRAMQMSESPISKAVPIWKEQKADWDFTAEKLNDGHKMLDAFQQILLITPEGKENECSQSLKSVYESQGWILSKSRYTPIHSMLAALPMGLEQEVKKSLNRFGYFRKRLSWSCVNMAPWVGEWKGTETPLMLFLGRRGQTVFFDPFDNKKGNYNISCSATSGSGKSFFTQEWIFSCLGVGGRAFVIDAGHSYRELCTILNGTYIDFGKGRPVINPFSKIFAKENIERVKLLEKEKPDEYSVDGYINDMLPMLKILLGVMASPESDLPQTEYSVLEMAMQEAIKEYKELTTITRVVEFLNKNIDHETGKINIHAKNVALKLHSYTKTGIFGKYFEGENNIDLDNPFVVLDLDDLNAKGDLQGVVLLILMMQISQVMYLSGNKDQRKLCIMDEAWRLLGSGRSGKFIEEGYRVARKHGGSFMTITQKISDYYSSETAKAAYANSDFKIYLRQDLSELSQAESLGYISNTSGKVDLIKGIETIQGVYSELAIDSPSGIGVVRFVVDKVTEKLYGTQPLEVQYIQNALEKGEDLFDILEELAKEKKR